MKIYNKPLFYTGLASQIVPLLIAIIWAFSFINWEWLHIVFNEQTLKYILIGFFLLLYEVASFLLIYGGLKK